VKRSEKFRFGERQATLVWAAVIGILGALVTECFRRATDFLHFLFTGSEATIITSFEGLPLWQRFLVPVIGGILAGLTLWIGNRLIANRNIPGTSCSSVFTSPASDRRALFSRQQPVRL
jgi:chloride channel protein, CIC family